jgi:hypothetical protein
VLVDSDREDIDAPAHLRRTHPDAPARDFSGPIGNATVTWDATGKTRVVAGVLSYLSTSGLDTGGHVRSNRYFIGPVWKATAHTSVNARYDRTTRSWRDIAAGALQSGRRDHVETASIGVDWAPRRLVTVSGSLRRERSSPTFPEVPIATQLSVGCETEV